MNWIEGEAIWTRASFNPSETGERKTRRSLVRSLVAAVKYALG